MKRNKQNIQPSSSRKPPVEVSPVGVVSNVPDERKVLTDKELDRLFTRKCMDAWSLSAFGGVMITKEVYSGRRVVDIMFRQEPDPGLPFSGWVFMSSGESPYTSSEERGLELHDCRAILRIAPEVATYLHMPPGTHLIRRGKHKFENAGEK